MSNITRKWNLLSKQKHETAIKEIITYFKTKQDQEIGVIAAEDILDFFLEMTGENIYNKAIEDTKEVIKQNSEILDVNINLLINK